MVTAVQEPPRLLTPREAAEQVLRVSAKTLSRLTQPHGPIPAVRVGRRSVRYTREALQEYIRQQQATATG
jgi:excisionase family DNA binding protein